MKRKGLFALLSVGFVLFLYACSKVNEPTELGGELIPAVDNVNTFDTSLTDLQVSYFPFDDTTQHSVTENMGLGKTNDPVFGTTNADIFFNLSSRVYGSSPFIHPDSVDRIDSVVLQLAYTGAAYGDTSAGSQVNVQVAEINDPGFRDSADYRYDVESFGTGPSLGNSTFSVRQFRDSTTVVRKTGDTARVANVLRIRLNNSLGQTLSKFDTLPNGNGAYRNDSIFRARFRGLAVKTTNVSGPGVLAYFNTYSTNTVLTVYYRKKSSTDLLAAEFVHQTRGRANSIRRTPGGPYLAGLNKSNPAELYIQSSPQGSYAQIFIPGLSTFSQTNKVIHRAELVAFRQPSALETIFTPPARLLLDHKGTGDTAYLFENDVQVAPNGASDLTLFGGNLRSDKSYRFNITRYVQGLVTRRERNDTLRLYAPLRSDLFVKGVNQFARVGNLPNIAAGRVVLAGVAHPDPNMRLRLRIIYSNL